MRTPCVLLAFALVVTSAASSRAAIVAYNFTAAGPTGTITGTFSYSTETPISNSYSDNNVQYNATAATPLSLSFAYTPTAGTGFQAFSESKTFTDATAALYILSHYEEVPNQFVDVFQIVADFDDGDEISLYLTNLTSGDSTPHPLTSTTLPSVLNLADFNADKVFYPSGPSGFASPGGIAFTSLTPAASSVPEPASVILLGTGLLGALGLTRHRARRCRA